MNTIGIFFFTEKFQGELREAQKEWWNSALKDGDQRKKNYLLQTLTLHHDYQDCDQNDGSAPSCNAREMSLPRESAKIQPKAIFDLHKSEMKNKELKPIKTVLVYGRAGMGKTLLARYFGQQWAERKFWQDKFEYVFLFSLRYFSANSNETISLCTLLLRRHGVEYSHSDEEWRKHVDPKKCLIIFDGLDEVDDFMKEMPRHPPVHSSETEDIPFKILMWNLLRGHMFKGCHIILTSRPKCEGLEFFEKHDCFDRKVDLNGFSKQQVFRYIERYFQQEDSTGRPSDPPLFLMHNENLLSICAVPACCHFIAVILPELQKGLENKADDWFQKPQTLLEIIILAFLYFVQKHHPAFKLHLLRALEPLEILHPIRDPVRDLSELAAICMQNPPSGFIIRPKFLRDHKFKVTSEMLSIGVLDSWKQKCFQLFQVDAEEFSFIHKSVMEFLAALHYCNDPKGTEGVFKDMTGGFDVVKLFLMGFMGDENCRKFAKFVYEPCGIVHPGWEQELAARAVEMFKMVCKIMENPKPLDKAQCIALLFEGQLSTKAEMLFEVISSKMKLNSMGRESVGLDLRAALLNPSHCKGLKYFLNSLPSPPDFIM